MQRFGKPAGSCRAGRCKVCRTLAVELAPPAGRRARGAEEHASGGGWGVGGESGIVRITMVDSSPEVEPARVDALLDAGDLAGGRAVLAQAPEGDERFTVVRIKLALYDGTMAPGIAMQQLIQLMRRDENFPGAKALYQEASRVAWQARQSNVSHSHPPPPARTRRDG